MSSTNPGQGSPDDVAVIGAGMVGLSTAWFLQESGVRVTVYERDHVGAGASWGNAGWLAPALTAPLPEPAVLRCTPLGGRLRVAGMMEFRRPGDALDPRRVTAVVDAVRPFLAGVDLEDRHDEWVGSRPCTPDGLPLVGPTAAPRVFVAGGHGMWGIVLGPVTGQLLAQTVIKGEVPPELALFAPLR